jgi:hypothetical protein
MWRLKCIPLVLTLASTYFPDALQGNKWATIHYGKATEDEANFRLNSKISFREIRRLKCAMLVLLYLALVVLPNVVPLAKSQLLRKSMANLAFRSQRMSTFTLQQMASTDGISINDTHFQLSRENMLEGVNHRCGTFKCFYPLKNTYQEKRVGYVAGTDSSLEQSLWAAYNFSITILQGEYGMQHTALAPPEMVPFQQGDELAFLLDHNKTGSNDQPRADVPSFAGHPRTYVQLVEDILSSEEPALFWGTSKNKQKLGMDAMQDWLRPIRSLSETGRREVVRRFESDARKLDKLLEDHPCLYDDFQLFIRNTGEIVHFDVDRCFYFDNESGRSLEKSIDEEAMHKSHNMIESLVQLLSDAILLEEGLQERAPV